MANNILKVNGDVEVTGKIKATTFDGVASKAINLSSNPTMTYDSSSGTLTLGVGGKTTNTTIDNVPNCKTATNYDTKSGTIKTKFDEIEGQLDKLGFKKGYIIMAQCDASMDGNSNKSIRYAIVVGIVAQIGDKIYGWMRLGNSYNMGKYYSGDNSEGDNPRIMMFFPKNNGFSIVKPSDTNGVATLSDSWGNGFLAYTHDASNKNRLVQVYDDTLYSKHSMYAFKLSNGNTIDLVYGTNNDKVSVGNVSVPFEGVVELVPPPKKVNNTSNVYKFEGVSAIRYNNNGNDAMSLFIIDGTNPYNNGEDNKYAQMWFKGTYLNEGMSVNDIGNNGLTQFWYTKQD